MVDLAPMFNPVLIKKLFFFSRIENGLFNSQGVRLYDSPPLTHIQKTMRRHTDGVLLDHITKHLGPLDVARIKFIPEGGGTGGISPILRQSLRMELLPKSLFIPTKTIITRTTFMAEIGGFALAWKKKKGCVLSRATIRRIR